MWNRAKWFLIMEMITYQKPRVVVAIEPPVLGYTIADVLTRIDEDEVVILDRFTGNRHPVCFDAALVSSSEAHKVAAVFVIELPDRRGNSGVGRVFHRGSIESVLINGPHELLRLLDEFCPTSTLRARRVLLE
jgi:hypothetical protein